MSWKTKHNLHCEVFTQLPYAHGIMPCYPGEFDTTNYYFHLKIAKLDREVKWDEDYKCSSESGIRRHM